MSNRPSFSYMDEEEGDTNSRSEKQKEKSQRRSGIRSYFTIIMETVGTGLWIVELEPWMNVLTTEELTNIKLKVKRGKVQCRMLLMQFIIFPRHGSDE